MDTELYILIGLGWLVSGMIGAGIANPRGQAAIGLVLGLLLGPLGWLIAGCVPRTPAAQVRYDRRLSSARAS